jgi:N-acetylglucosaminyldiphosphoundecaprenol N-acetyl-beta-D-mannosaminyltransferase
MDVEMWSARSGARILDTFVDSLSLTEALEKSSEWAQSPRARTVHFCNVHSLVTASVHPAFAQSCRDADLILPDGSPVAWMLRVLGYPAQKRISGPDFMWLYCAAMQERNGSVYLYGNKQTTLEKLANVLHETFPQLRIAGMLSPPYRTLTNDEDERIVNEINASGAQVVFVSLGCPKQELWMMAHRGRIHAVMLGVGAAFDYHAGTVQRPPLWVQNSGLEWFCRLTQEPKRLWKRYLIANAIFTFRAFGQTFDHVFKRQDSAPRIGESSSQPSTEPDS